MRAGVLSPYKIVIGGRYADAVAQSPCTPCFEVRDIHFYLRKFGFHIVDLIEEVHEETAESGERDFMLAFVKRAGRKMAVIF